MPQLYDDKTVKYFEDKTRNDHSITYEMIKEAALKLQQTSAVPKQFIISTPNFPTTDITDIIRTSMTQQAFDRLYSSTWDTMPKFTPYIIDDPEFKTAEQQRNQQKKETQMIFKFVTERPDPETIWTILEATNIEPFQGYTTYQLKLIMFLVLSSETFSASRDLCNRFLDGKTPSAFANMRNIIISNYSQDFWENISTLQLVPSDLPVFHKRSMYNLYYAFMQLDPQMLVDAEMNTPKEIEYLSANKALDHSQYITLYTLWKLGYPTETHFNRIFSVEQMDEPFLISSKEDLIGFLGSRLYEFVAEIPVFTVGEDRIPVPTFQLKESK